jgi:multiple sugar transport system permease protein
VTLSRIGNRTFSLLLLAPALALLAFTVLYPLGRGIYLSFQTYSLVDPTKNGFVGLDNYRTLLDSAAYREVWTTTMAFVLASVSGQFIVGFFTALVLNNRDLKRTGLFRGLLLVPWIVPTVVTSLLWSGSG